MPTEQVRLVVVLALAVVLAVVALISVQSRPDDETGATPSSPSPTATATEAGAATPTSSGSPEATQAPTETPEATQTTADPDALPANTNVRRDPTGFSVALPKSWERSTRGSSVYFRDPKSGAYLQVDTTTTPKPDALKDWQAAEPSARQRFSGYKLISLDTVDYRNYDAADWEYTWRASSGTLHVINRNIRVSDKRAYALVWSVPSGDWDKRESDFEIVKETFKPAK